MKTTTKATRRTITVDELGNEIVRRNGEAPPLASLASVPVGVQKVQTQYATSMSVQRPRELRAVEHSAMDEASLLGADAFYAWGAGKDSICGPSVGLAMCLVRCWGNCAVDMGEVQDTPDAWIFTAKFVDLETGYTLTRQFRQSKDWAVYGKFDEARKDDIRFQIGQSKAVRNVILNAVPRWLVNRALDKAKGGVREAIEKAVEQYGMEKVVAKAMGSLAELGADENRVLAAMGRKTAQAITIEDLVILRGSIAALESGADDVDGVFPVKVAEQAPQAARGAAGLAAKLAAKNGQQASQDAQEGDGEAPASDNEPVF